jgi:acyl-CoA reductase-like NAD-dependent aldehyde dehydrogenase
MPALVNSSVGSSRGITTGLEATTWWPLDSKNFRKVERISAAFMPFDRSWPPWSGATETRAAIAAADKAWAGVAGLTAKERAAILRKWFDLLMANRRTWRAS